LNFGFTDRQKNLLKHILSKYIGSGAVIVYGSRANGKYTERSDVDLVIRGCNENSERLLLSIKDEIDESDFPFLVDIQYYESIKNPELINHINHVGKIIFECGKAH